MNIREKSGRELAVGLSLSLTLTLVILGIYLIEGFEWLELRTYDLRVQFRGPNDFRTPIVMVMNDEQTIERLGIPPSKVSRAQYAQAVTNLNRAGVKIIAFDVMFAGMTSHEHDEAMAQAIQNAGNVILARYMSERGQVIPLEVFRVGEFGEGLINIALDIDGVLRAIPLLGLTYEDTQVQPVLFLGAEAARLFLDPAGKHLLDVNTPNVLKLGPVRIPSPEGKMLVNYYGPPGTFPSIPLWRAIKGELDDHNLQGKIALVGAKAATFQDFYQTPYGKKPSQSLGGGRAMSEGHLMTGLEVQANVVQTILDGAFVERSTRSFMIWLIGFVGFGCWMFIMVYPKTAMQVTGFCVLLLVAFIGTSLYLFHMRNYWLDLVPLLFLVNGHYGMGMAFQRYVVMRQKDQLRSMFSQYVSPQVAEVLWDQRTQLLEEGFVKSQPLTVTTLVAGLEDFSFALQHVSHEKLLHWVNYYLDRMAQEIITHHGVIEEYGEGKIRANFGVPVPRLTEHEIFEDAQNAVKCAFAMVNVVERANAKWESIPIPPLTLRVGISTGSVVAGSIGHRDRLKYVTMGESVERASWIQRQGADLEVKGTKGHVFSEETTTHYLSAQYQAIKVGPVSWDSRCPPVMVYRLSRTQHGVS